MKPFFWLAIALSPFAMGLNCIQQTKTTSQPKARTTVTLRGFTSPDELRNYLADQAQAASTSTRTGGLFGFLAPLTSVSSGPVPAAAEGAVADSSNSSASGSSFSST